MDKVELVANELGEDEQDVEHKANDTSIQDMPPGVGDKKLGIRFRIKKKSK